MHEEAKYCCSSKSGFRVKKTMKKHEKIAKIKIIFVFVFRIILLLSIKLDISYQY